MKLTKEGQDKVAKILQSIDLEPCVFIKHNIPKNAWMRLNAVSIAPSGRTRLTIFLEYAMSCNSRRWGLYLYPDKMEIDWAAGRGTRCSLTTKSGEDFFKHYVTSKLTLDDIEE